MPALIGLTSSLVILLLIWIVLVAPSPRRRGVRPFLSARYAHRGLHGEGAAENSLTAFRLAVEGGYGIELDVRVSADGEVVVCHDPTLLRVAGDARAVRELTCAQLAAVSLLGTADGVPTLAEVLTLVGGRVPLLIEIKEDTSADCDVVPRLLPLLSSYEGPVMIESFNPLSLRRVRRAAPHLVRGLLCESFHRSPEHRSLSFRLLEGFFLNVLARPHFIAYNHRHRRALPFRLMRLFAPPTLAYTVTSAEEEAAARADGFDTVIFEGYLPKEETV